MRIQLVSGPDEEPVSEREFKEQARLEVGDTTDDEYIARILEVARNEVEDWTGRRIMDSTYDYWIDGWPDGEEIVVPFPPLIWTAADSYVKYYCTPVNTGGVISYTTTTWATTEYGVDRNSEPGRLVLEYGKTFPTVTLRPYNPIEIRFDCGWADPDDVPEKIKQAVLLLATDMYEVRQDTIIGAVKAVTLDAARHLMDDYCVEWL